jgi:putative endonuclease
MTTASPHPAGGTDLAPAGPRPKPRVASPGVHARDRLGRLGEELAASHFQRLGFRVLARNVRTRQGELDLIVFDGETLVFVEVKTRRTPRDGTRRDPDRRPLDRLGPRQRVRIRRLASAWLAESGRERPRARTLRFDAVGVVVDGRGRLLSLEHLEAAW